MTRLLLTAPSSHQPLSPAACRPPPKVFDEMPEIIFTYSEFYVVTFVSHHHLLMSLLQPASIISSLELKKHRSTAPTLVSWSRQSLSISPNHLQGRIEHFHGCDCAENHVLVSTQGWIEQFTISRR
ncbi:hypothetical protein L1987_62972 [Smallanthus sonchifolius]|uniref:Uncharacterized protein n=1 Tax=Smallanthus sonchifolius TaxID=185202 RepID=A0ACB9CBW6_9ASTR|nr:hypothetical protein L1987_62972 [Smallanthus sonchifolius]